MEKESLEKALKYIESMEMAIKYLEENKVKLVNDAVDYIISTDSNYLKGLRKNDNLKLFKKSIIDGHIQWIIEDIYNPEKVDFTNYNLSFVKSTPQAYCNIYKYLSKNIKNNSNLSKNTKNILQDYFTSFFNLYC